jgi:Effector Associated Constant Component 1
MTYDFIFELGGEDETTARALTSLYRWLREDPTVDGDTRVRLMAAELEPGQMGAADVLCAALSQLTAIGSLAVSFATWRDSRATAPPVRIRLGAETIELSDASAEELAAALRALAVRPSPTPPEADDPDAAAAES